jgi:hypothetical protein
VNRIDRCLSQVAAIRAVAAGQAPPYVARSRIGRLALSVAALVAQEAGLSAPDLPRPIRVPAGAPAQLRDLAERCNRLSQLARHVAQPSEPLDDRWRRGWHQLLGEVSGLEEQLQSMRGPVPSQVQTPSGPARDLTPGDVALAPLKEGEPSPPLTE